jgi:hypothetical protein
VWQCLLHREDVLRIANDGGDGFAIAPKTPPDAAALGLCHRAAYRSIAIFNIRLAEAL